MGMDWDPEGDAERRKENRNRLWLTIAIVVGLLGVIGNMLYKKHQESERERELRKLYEVQQNLRGY